MVSSAKSAHKPARAQAGRPSRITGEQIAAAALKVGLDRATIRIVADELGVSVPGLYHHVRTREQLLEMALAHSFKLLPTTLVKSDPWDVTLKRYSRDIYDHLVRQPEIINFISSGSIVSAGYALHLDVFLEGASKRGFSPHEAYGIFVNLMTVIIGAAVLEAGDRAMARNGKSLFSGLRAQCSLLSPQETTYLRQLLEPSSASVPDHFGAVEDMIASIAFRYESKVARVVLRKSVPASSKEGQSVSP
jgi:AcrR family transcriptional regulator